MDRIWGLVGSTVNNPISKPFHVYRPRKRANFKQAAELLGVGALTRAKGVKAIPIASPRGGKIRRVRLEKDRIAIDYRTPGIQRQYILAVKPVDVVRNLDAVVKRALATGAKSFALKVGGGRVFTTAENLASQLSNLSSYPDFDKFFGGIEAVK